MKKLLEICTKEMHFSFNNTIYKQVNGVAMGSPLGPVIANIFMAELEKTIIPQLGNKVSLWQRYVDDTFTFIKKGEVETVLETLNAFHESIKFTFEKEAEGKISFLDVMVIKNEDGTFETDIHRKKTDTNVYMHWNSFSPKSWKIGTMNSLVRRAHVICSKKEFFDREIQHLKSVFRDENGFPSRVVNSTIDQVRRTFEENTDIQNRTADAPAEEATSNEVTPFICLQYKGKEGEEIISKFKEALKSTLPDTIKPRFTYRGKKVGSLFRIKDPVPKEHETNLIYSFKDGGVTKYIGQTNVRYGTRVEQHCGSDKQSSVYRYKQDKSMEISAENFEIVDKGYSRLVNRRIAEALYVKEFKEPELNKQKKSAKLLLFD